MIKDHELQHGGCSVSARRLAGAGANSNSAALRLQYNNVNYYYIGFKVKVLVKVLAIVEQGEGSRFSSGAI